MDKSTLTGAFVALMIALPASGALGDNHGHGATHGGEIMDPVKAGDIEISQPVVRATPAHARVSAGYLVIANPGAQADRLVGVSADFAGKITLHRTIAQDNIIKMREIVGGVEIPAGAEVKFQPGGAHIMFMRLTEQLKPGETRMVVLEFERAGAIEVAFPVMEIGHGHGGNTDHSGH